MHGGLAAVTPWALRDGRLEDGYWIQKGKPTRRADILAALEAGKERPNMHMQFSESEDRIVTFGRYLNAKLATVEASLRVAPDVFDYTNFHQYGDWRSVPVAAQWLRDEMRERGYSMPLAATEVGGPFWARGEAYTYELQAEDIVKWHCVCLASGVEIIMWSSMVAARSWGEAFANTSLVDWNTGELKPAYHTYCLMVGKLRDIESVRRLPLNEWEDDTRMYEFVTPRGKLRIAWSDDTSGRHQRMLWEYSSATITHVDGRTEAARVEKGILWLDLTRSPVFIEPE